jgi:hypothetical protein
LHLSFDSYYLLNHRRYFLDDFVDIGDNLFYLLYSLVNNNLLNNLLDVLDSDLLLFGLNDLLDELRNLDDLLDNFSDRNKLLNKNLHRHGDLVRDHDVLLHLNHFYFLVIGGHDVLDGDNFWYLSDHFH